MPIRDQILDSLDQVLKFIEGTWDQPRRFPDPDTEHPLAGPTPVPCDHDREMARLRRREAELTALSWRIFEALGRKGPEDIAPEARLDLLVAERDALAIQVQLLTGELDGLRDQQDAEPDPRHEIQILRETVTDEGLEIRITCAYSACLYDATIRTRVGGLAHQIVDTLAEAHEDEMEATGG